MHWGAEGEATWPIVDSFGERWRFRRVMPGRGTGGAAASREAVRELGDLVYFSLSSHGGGAAASRVLHRVHAAMTGRRLVPDRREDPRGLPKEVHARLLGAIESGTLVLEREVERRWPFPDDDAPPSLPDAGAPVEESTTFIELRLVDQDGQPVPRRAVHLEFSDKSEREGFFDKEGKFYADDVPSGDGTATFPDLDATDFSAPLLLVGKDTKEAEGPAHVEAETDGVVVVAEVGDTMSSLAERFGFLHFATIWSHETNAHLRAVRRDPHVLLPGDEVVIPEKRSRPRAVATGRTTTLTVFTQKLSVKLKPVDASREPVPLEASEIEADAGETADATRAGGVVSVTVPRSSHVLTSSDLGDARCAVGALSPLREERGPEARLENLGHGVFPEASLDESSGSDERLELAIELFEAAEGKKPTGKISDDLLAALERATGA